MNDLTVYQSLKPIITHGLVAFKGKGLLSSAIEFFSHGSGWVPSHIALIVDPYLIRSVGSVGSVGVTNVLTLPDIYLTESTIYEGESGPQFNSLAARIASYGPGSARYYPFSPLVATKLEWDKVWSLMWQKTGHDRYNKLELGADALDRLPITDELHVSAQSGSKEVCSEYVLELLLAGGLLSLLNGVPYPYNSVPYDIITIPGLLGPFVQLFDQKG